MTSPAPMTAAEYTAKYDQATSRSTARAVTDPGVGQAAAQLAGVYGFLEQEVSTMERLNIRSYSTKAAGHLSKALAHLGKAWQYVGGNAGILGIRADASVVFSLLGGNEATRFAQQVRRDNPNASLP